MVEEGRRIARIPKRVIDAMGKMRETRAEGEKGVDIDPGYLDSRKNTERDPQRSQGSRKSCCDIDIMYASY